jgi:serine/threonine protein kinase
MQRWNRRPLRIRACGWHGFFFGIVLYALIKSDFIVEQSRLTSDPVQYDSANGLRKIQAVKICNPSCPSGIKASGSYLIKEIEAMKQVWSSMEERVHHNFVKLYNYSTSDAPWYSMEPVMSGLTLEKLYITTQAQLLPIPEELAFHIVDQITKACLFLYEKCRMVSADVNRENVILRYPGRETALMPDVVLIDWSLWEEANAERIDIDTRGVYEFLCPFLFGGGWRCGTRHDENACTIKDVAHSQEWLDLYNTMSTKHLSLEHLR